jgi:hypothetical protein
MKQQRTAGNTAAFALVLLAPKLGADVGKGN